MTTYLVLVSVALFACVTAQPANDEITALPGWDKPLPSKQYSGYLDVDGRKHLHYWLVESEGNPDKDPTVLWLNGGPGCSSLDGLVYEHGPFRINETDNTKLVRFDHTWAKLANMLYLEAPVGVGYSYSDDKKDYKTNDDQTALDSTAAMNAFFDAFPKLKSNDFFITGESYAGVYVPTLAEGILHATQAGNYTGAPLKGIAVGNGCSGNEVGSCGGQREQYDTEFLLGQAFVSKSLKTKIRATCDFSKKVTAACDALLTEMHATIGNVNLYDIYGECISGSAEHAAGELQQKAPYDNKYAKFGGPNACINSIAGSNYINQPSVIAATHVVKQSFEWSTCGNQIQYRSTRPNLPRDTYPALIKNYKVLIYNGDWDACVPYTDNQAWTEGMGYPVAKAWHPWTFNGTQPGQVGGYATRYENNDFTFITIKGGRHEVPETAPRQALEMLRRFLASEPF